MATQNNVTFSKMYIDLSKVSAGQSVLAVFPEHQEVKSFNKASEYELKVAIFMCDPYGPFGLIKLFNKRLDSVFEWYKLDATGKHKELYQSIHDLKNDNVFDIWTDYLNMQFEHDYTSWFTNSMLYYQMNEELRKPLDMGDINFDKAWARKIAIEKAAKSVFEKIKAAEEYLFIDSVIKRKANEKEKGKIHNYAEMHADINSVI